MQARERTTLIRQMLTGASYGPVTVWRCALCLALVTVVSLQGSYQTAAPGGTVAAAKQLRTVDDVRAGAHRKVLFDARRLRFEKVAAPRHRARTA